MAHSVLVLVLVLPGLAGEGVVEGVVSNQLGDSGELQTSLSLLDNCWSDSPQCLLVMPSLLLQIFMPR